MAITHKLLLFVVALCKKNIKKFKTLTQGLALVNEVEELSFGVVAGVSVFEQGTCHFELAVSVAVAPAKSCTNKYNAMCGHVIKTPSYNSRVNTDNI